jgi:hypothetical protein
MTSVNELLRRFVVPAAILMNSATAVVALEPAGSARHPWSANTNAGDQPRRYVEDVVADRHEYRITQHGTLDGDNCRSPVGVFEGWEQTWESNRAVRIENQGQFDVVNPWLSNGRNQVRSADEIIRAAITPGMTDREKAIAIWRQETQHRFHFSTWDQEDNNPVKVFNLYGFNTCGDDSMCLAGLWRRAGLRVRPARIVGHCVSQVYYEGKWHLMDGDMHAIYLLRDNKTIASEHDVVADHDLIKRSRTHGILAPDSRQTSEWEASLYVYEGEAEATRDMLGDHTMRMVLRPKESLTWRWGHLTPIKYHGGNPPKYPDRVCNGVWEYRPDFTEDLWRSGTESCEAIQTTGTEVVPEPGHTGKIIWKIRSPYVMVGGEFRAESTEAQFFLSWDAKEWQATSGNLDRFFPPEGPARYEYFLRCELPVDASLRRLQIRNDLQMAPLALPEMRVGENRFIYSDESTTDRQVRITHEWIERSTTHPPDPPANPIWPLSRGRVDGTDIEFQWAAANDLDGDPIKDYHFQLADRQDMKWPLSTNFDKLVSRTADSGTARYRLPEVGLLNSGQTYYWRVRAQDQPGVWGSWSDTWSFQPRAPAYPLAITIEYDPSAQIGTLHWEPNPAGRRPVRYRIYGSDEKGFSVHDSSYQRFIGNQPSRVNATAPANFLAETERTELQVIGRNLEQSTSNRAYYRVVAVDASGARSTASEYAVAPRPVIYSRPVEFAEVAAPYRYQLSAVRSLGDLRCRSPNGDLEMSFWDIEQPWFAIERGPEWLQLDPVTGQLSGQPNTEGRFPVVVSAAIDRQVRVLDETRLSWGQEEVLEVTTERLGTARQEFVIRVTR